MHIDTIRVNLEATRELITKLADEVMDPGSDPLMIARKLMAIKRSLIDESLEEFERVN